jgi:hypothetical protein
LPDHFVSDEQLDTNFLDFFPVKMNLGPGSMSSFTRVLEIRFSRGPFALART